MKIARSRDEVVAALAAQEAFRLGETMFTYTPPPPGSRSRISIVKRVQKSAQKLWAV